MFFKYLTAAVLATSVAVIPADSAKADAGDFIAGAIIGGIVGSAATKQNQQKKRQKVYRSGIPSTQEGRIIQTSLNYFGFNAGRVDGQLGRQSRAAVSNFQAYMGYPVTGLLTPYEYNELTTAYGRAQAGGFATNQAAASHPDGVRGLLKNYRTAQAGGVPVQVAPPPTTTVVVAPQPAPVATPAPATTVVAAAPKADANEALPNFFGSTSQASLASHCNTVSLVTNTNGGFTTAASMTDPMVALNEQFCLARTYAIARSEEMISQIQGVTPQQVAEQCAAFAPAMKDQVAALSLKQRDEVAQKVSGFILSTGMSPAELSGTAKICLGVGYRTDNMDVALASGLLLYALGEGVYGELMGHHLAMGFGTTKRPDVALTWYEASLAASDGGADAVFVPGQPERTELIRKASMQLTGSGASAATPLPVFSVTE